MSVLQSQVLKGSVPLQAITIAFIFCGLSANINASVLRFLWHSTLRQPLSQAWLNSNNLVDLQESISWSNKLGHCLEHPVEQISWKIAGPMNGGFYKSIIDDEAISKAEIPLQRL
jgi:hypothetical protein